MVDVRALTSDAVIELHGEVLLLERAQSPFEGYWVLPGGLVEPMKPPGKRVSERPRKKLVLTSRCRTSLVSTTTQTGTSGGTLVQRIDVPQWRRNAGATRGSPPGGYVRSNRSPRDGLRSRTDRHGRLFQLIAPQQTPVLITECLSDGYITGRDSLSSGRATNHGRLAHHHRLIPLLELSDLCKTCRQIPPLLHDWADGSEQYSDRTARSG